MLLLYLCYSYSKDFKCSVPIIFYIDLSKMFTVVPVATDIGVYSVARSDGIRLYIHREQRLIGPFFSVAKILHIDTGGSSYNRFKTDTKAKPYSTNMPKITLYSIESYIEYINRYTKKLQHEKRGVINAINEYLRAIDNAVVQTDPIKDIASTNDLKYISLERRIAKLEHIISHILETYPDTIIDEQVKVIDSSTITEYNILVTVDKEVDGKIHLNVEHILSDEYEPVENALMDKAFYISLNQLNELKQKMLLKSDGDLVDIGNDYAIVKDVDDFIDTFKHKLRNIQKKNRKSDDASSCSAVTA